MPRVETETRERRGPQRKEGSRMEQTPTALDKAMKRLIDATEQVGCQRRELKLAIQELDEAEKALKREARAATKP